MSDPAAHPTLPFGPERLARRGDPISSREAASAAGGVRNHHAILILATIRRAGRGLSTEEVVQLSGGGLTSVQVARRWSELVERGFVRREGFHLNQNGRREVRHVLCMEVRS